MEPRLLSGILSLLYVRNRHIQA